MFCFFVFGTGEQIGDLPPPLKAVCARQEAGSAPDPVIFLRLPASPTNTLLATNEPAASFDLTRPDVLRGSWEPGEKNFPAGSEPDPGGIREGVNPV